MTIDDYDEVYALWKSIRGFGIRSMDDSQEGIGIFLKRNPDTSAVAKEGGRIIGAALCGNDGRYGYLYHVCVHQEWRRRKIGKQMVTFCMNALKQNGINKMAIIAFTSNSTGNEFWRHLGWKERGDLNYYDFVLNEKNIIAFNESY